MDDILSEFISRTKADPALAHDLLDATDWNLEAAISAFEGLHDTHAVLPEDTDFEFESALHLPDMVMVPEEEDDDTGPLPELADVRDNTKRKKHHKKSLRGLSYVADDVLERFMKVAVMKQRVSSEEQVTIEDHFFRHSFVYPDFSSEPGGLQEFIAADLIETSHKTALEKSGRLNWWTKTGKLPRLEPLATSGDGNCLLHAASLYMWGFHDQELILRTALHRLLTAGLEKNGLYRRWRYQTQIRNEEAIGLRFSEEEWEFEWSEVVRIATNRPRREPTTDSLRRYSSLRIRFESLEEVHVFALAHVLRRPIIVIADKVLRDISGEDLAPIYFAGIYLPFEVSPTLCYKSPMVLAYDSSHFSPLVAKEEKREEKKTRYARMSGRKDIVIPLVTADGALLPVQFVVDPKTQNVDPKWARMGYTPGVFPPDIIHLLESYLQVRWIQLKEVAIPPKESQQQDGSDSEDYDHLLPIEVPKIRFPAALITHEAQPIYQKELVEKYLVNVQERFEEEKEWRKKREEEVKKREEELRLKKPVPCKGEGCTMFGTASTNNLCSFCYQKGELNGKSEDSQTNCQDENETQQEEFVIIAAGDLPEGGHELPPPPPPPTTSEVVRGRSSSDEQSSHNSPVSQPRLNHSHSNPTPSSDTTDSEPPANNGQSNKAPAGRKTSPKSSGKRGWVKKLHNPLSGLRKKTSTNSGGYTRDNIQPIGLQSHQPAVAGVKRIKCTNDKCDFYGSEDKGGLCSKCYKEAGRLTVV